MRRPLIAGNWKLNKTPSETVDLIEAITNYISSSKYEIAVCPPVACLFAARGALAASDIKLGAQDVFFENKGAYTGETSVDALAELGVEYVIVGHSERRQYFGETDGIVNKKVLKTLDSKMKPIVCVGESLDQRNDGIAVEVVRVQTKSAFKDVGEGYVADAVIAYEPVWAIGTGMTATPEDANGMIRAIRRAIADKYDNAVAGSIRILYGGSMNAENARSLLSMSDIDGGLIGGASLCADSFAAIVNAC
jgi:triosephosphate isomerase